MADDIEYRLMGEGDSDGVVTLLTESFLVDGPLCKAMQFDIPRETNDWVIEQVADCGSNGLAIVAIDKETCQIIGARLSKVVTKDTDLRVMETTDANKAKTTLVARFLKKLYEGIDIFKAYGVDEYVHFKILNVRRDYGRRGIAQRLVDEATKVARGLGYRLFIVEVTGNYSIRLYEKLGFDVLNTIMYDDYRDVNGERIFGDTGEHQMAKLMGKLYE